MSKSVSFRSVLTIPAFAHLNERDLLDVKMDKYVWPYLHEFGVDIEYPVEIIVNDHRDLNNKTGIGYLYCGEIRVDSAFRKSPFCTLTDILVINSYRDRSLSQELATIMSQGTMAFDGEGEDEAFLDEHVESSFGENTAQINVLKEMLYNARGSQRNASGGLMMSYEYLEKEKA